VTPEERIQTGEINVTHRRALKKKNRRALRFAGTATGEVEVVEEQVHRHQLPPKEYNMPVLRSC